MKFRKDARAGEFWSVNTKREKGHKGLIAKRKSNGNIEVIISTHSQYTRGRKNIKLQENPQANDFRDSYVLSKLSHTNIKHLGKHHPEMKIKNKTDKSIVRKIKSKNKKR